MVTVPRVVIAAPASGCGKTTVATGLMVALRRRSLRVSPHKVGPDYIDPGYHALACGRPGRNLDAFLCGEARVAPLFAHAAADADVAVVEGVMGLYDGVAGSPSGFASTAHVARLLDAPVVLVVDATGQGPSVAALVGGFAAFDRRVRLGGVVLNRVGSDRHEQILREALTALGVPVLGALRREDAVATPSRHLGLVPVAERAPEATRTVDALGDLVARAVDLDAVLALARSAPPLRVEAWSPAAAVPVAAAAANPGRAPSRPLVAVAGGSAFTFSYAETPELLMAAGADIVIIDPLRDEALPAGTRALVIGGGFPEVYAAELSANEQLRRDVSDLCASGAPVIAECAGLLYLAEELDGLPMCGVVPTRARMAERLTLGYRAATAASDSVVTSAGELVSGHEFHRTVCAPAAGERPAFAWDDATSGFVAGPRGNVVASYLHTHWAATPDAAARLVAAA